MAPHCTFRRGQFIFAVLTAIGTLFLISVGGVVTSKAAGMAVPDWPTTYGYNMFLFPFSHWIGGVFYEHSHRLTGALVGMLTMGLALWIGIRDERRCMKRLGALAVVLVVLQGVLGGLRVRWMANEIGIFHATLAQLFFILICYLALFSSAWWTGSSPAINEKGANSTVSSVVRRAVMVATALIFIQLILGATMRHQHSGLAIPDFPLAYGQWWPPLDAASLERINQQRLDVREFSPVTATHIVLHMMHRLGALAILAAVGWVVWLGTRYRQPRWLRSGSWAWLGLIVVQAFLGAATVWSNKAADVATAHVVVGACNFALGSLLVAACWKFSVATSDQVLHAPSGVSPSGLASPRALVISQ